MPEIKLYSRLYKGFDLCDDLVYSEIGSIHYYGVVGNFQRRKFPFGILLIPSDDFLV